MGKILNVTGRVIGGVVLGVFAAGCVIMAAEAAKKGCKKIFKK